LNRKNILTLTLGIAAAGIIGSAQVAHADTQIDNNTVQVSQGDTLGEIASEHNISLDSLVKENHIGDANLIYVGDKLSINVSNAQSSVPKSSVPQSPSVQSNQATAATQKTVPQVSQSYSNGGSEQAAKNTLAQRESGGSYTATNGNHYGKYQLINSYLNGDYSPANQEAVANNYVSHRYGSWDKALEHSNATGWY